MAADAYVRDCPGIYRPNVPTREQIRDVPRRARARHGLCATRRCCARCRTDETCIVIGQKDGHVWALDPDKQGDVVWSRQVGLGLATSGGGAHDAGRRSSDDRPAYFLIDARRVDRLGLAAVEHRQPAKSPGARRRAEAGGAPASGHPRRRVLRVEHGHHVRVTRRPTGRAHLAVRHGARVRDRQRRARRRAGTSTPPDPVVAGGMVFVPSGYSDSWPGRARQRPAGVRGAVTGRGLSLRATSCRRRGPFVGL